MSDPGRLHQPVSGKPERGKAQGSMSSPPAATRAADGWCGRVKAQESNPPHPDRPKRMRKRQGGEGFERTADASNKIIEVDVPVRGNDRWAFAGADDALAELSGRSKAAKGEIP